MHYFPAFSIIHPKSEILVTLCTLSDNMILDFFSPLDFLFRCLSASFLDKPTPHSTEVMPEQFPVPENCPEVYK